MKHSFDGTPNINGAIFTLNDNPFEDYETIIYGHNMKNGIMFSQLGEYMKKEFLDEHSIIDIYTKIQNYKATVVDAYSIEINTEENNIKPLQFKEKIVRLSTCSYLNSTTIPTNQRYYIIAKLEKVD